MKRLIIALLSISLLAPIAPLHAITLSEGAKTVHEGFHSVWDASCSAAFGAYENVQVLRVISIAGLASIGLYACCNKLYTSFQRARYRRGGYTGATLDKMESAVRYGAAGGLIAATALTVYSLIDYNRLYQAAQNASDASEQMIEVVE